MSRNHSFIRSVDGPAGADIPKVIYIDDEPRLLELTKLIFEEGGDVQVDTNNGHGPHWNAYAHHITTP